MTDEGQPVSFSAFAAHRRLSRAAVSKGVTRGRLRTSIVTIDGRRMLSSLAAADREWDANTDTRRCSHQAAPLRRGPSSLAAVEFAGLSLEVDNDRIVLGWDPHAGSDDDDAPIDACGWVAISPETAGQLARRLQQLARAMAQTGSASLAESDTDGGDDDSDV